MNDDPKDTQLDGALEALARAVPPRHHVERVLARTSVNSTGSQGQADAAREADALRGRPHAAGYGLQAAGYLRPRWLLPVAATVLAVLGATWQSGRQVRDRLDASMVLDVRATVPGAAVWGAPQDIDRPVLPPYAYWGMDPFAEFATLRPGAFAVTPRATRAPVPERKAHAPEMAWAAVPSGLPPIELDDIAPAAIEVAPLAPLEDIAPAEIVLAPIVIAPFTEEERP